MALVAFSNKRNQADLAANNRLDLFLRDLDERKGKIPSCQEVSLIQSRVRKVIRSILLEVRRENPFFRTTLINSGSFYEGTKVGQPDEFDFLIQLDGFSGPERVRFDELPCSTVLVCPSQSTWEDLHYYFPDQSDLCFGYFEWKTSIKTPFYKIFSKKAKDFEAYGMKVVLEYEADENVTAAPPLTKHGPAYTLLLEWNGGERYKGLRISVDLALAVKINNRPKVDIEVESPTWRVLQSLFDNLPCYFAVGAYRDVLSEVNPNFFADCDPSLRPQDFCLRCSQSCLEQVLFCQTFGPDSGQAKCLRLLKVLRDIVFPDTEIDFKNSNDSGFWEFDVDSAADSLKSTGRLVSSYVLKTLVLFEWQQKPADEQWCGNNLSQRLLNVLRSLIDHLKGRKLRSFFYADYNIFPSSVTQDMDFLNVASIITILLDGLAFIGNMNEYNFEECMTKIKEDFVEVIYRKMTFTSLLLTGLRNAFLQDSSLEKVVEKSLRKEGKEIDDLDDVMSVMAVMARAMRVLEENGEKSSLWNIYVQALLDSIAPNETLILTNVNVKDTKSLSQAGQQFEKIARRRMATSLDKLPSYSLWTQEHWRLEGSVYKYTTDEPRKLLAFLFSAFREDIDILLNEMKDY